MQAIGGGTAFPVNAPRSEYEARARDLEQMRAVNSDNMPMGLAPTAMPQSFEDLSFLQRWEITQEGWQHPAAARTPMYMQMAIESDERARIREDAAIAARHKREADQEARDAAARKAELEKRKLESEAGRAEWCRAFPAECQKENEQIARAQMEQDRLTMTREAFCARYPGACTNPQEQGLGDRERIANQTGRTNQAETGITPSGSGNNNVIIFNMD